MAAVSFGRVRLDSFSRGPLRQLDVAVRACLSSRFFWNEPAVFTSNGRLISEPAVRCDGPY